jgi:hypothetical protein
VLGKKLTTHSQLVLKVIMKGVMPPFPKRLHNMYSDNIAFNISSLFSIAGSL